MIDNDLDQKHERDLFSSFWTPLTCLTFLNKQSHARERQVDAWLRLSNLASKFGQIVSKWDKSGTFKISVSTFWRTAPKCTETDLKKSKICPFWGGEPKCTETDLKKVPDLSHLGPIWPNSDAKFDNLGRCMTVESMPKNRRAVCQSRETKAIRAHLSFNIEPSKYRTYEVWQAWHMSLDHCWREWSLMFWATVSHSDNMLSVKWHCSLWHNLLRQVLSDIQACDKDNMLSDITACDTENMLSDIVACDIDNMWSLQPRSG